MASENQGERIAKLEAQLEAFEKDVHAIKDDVRQIRDALLQGKGSWKTAAALIGLAGSVVVSLVANWVISIWGVPK